MPSLRYVTHPEVVIDPAVPVPRWGLSDRGRERLAALLERGWLSSVGRVVSSDEKKAVQTADCLARVLGLEVEVRPVLGENDRSATGVVSREEFERLADAFFARPRQSVRGWERAVDAQSRITSGLADLLDPGAERDVVVVGHGGVGTLWYCQLAGLAIDRRHDQPHQGCYFSVDLADATPLHPWLPFEHDAPTAR